MALFKVVEFLILIVILITILKMLWSNSKKVHISATSEEPERFDASGADICDGEYEEIR